MAGIKTKTRPLKNLAYAMQGIPMRHRATLSDIEKACRRRRGETLPGTAIKASTCVHAARAISKMGLDSLLDEMLGAMKGERPRAAESLWKVLSNAKLRKGMLTGIEAALKDGDPHTREMTLRYAASILSNSSFQKQTIGENGEMFILAFTRGYRLMQRCCAKYGKTMLFISCTNFVDSMLKNPGFTESWLNENVLKYVASMASGFSGAMGGEYGAYSGTLERMAMHPKFTPSLLPGISKISFMHYSVKSQWLSFLAATMDDPGYSSLAAPALSIALMRSHPVYLNCNVKYTVERMHLIGDIESANRHYIALVQALKQEEKCIRMRSPYRQAAGCA